MIVCCNCCLYSLVNGYLSLILPLESQICQQENRHLIHLEPWTNLLCFPWNHAPLYLEPVAQRLTSDKIRNNHLLVKKYP